MPFAVLSSQRSGSHLLFTLLNSHDNISCDGELFLNRSRTIFKEGEIDRIDILDFGIKMEKEGKISFNTLTNFEFNKNTDEAVVWGMLIKYSQLGKRLENNRLLNKICNDFKVIILTRRNKVNMIMSHFLMGHIRRNSSFGNIHYVSEEEIPLTLSLNNDTIDNLKKKMRRVVSSENKFKKYVKSNTSYIEVYYEDITNNSSISICPEEISFKLCSFLGVRREILSSPLIKNSGVQPEKVITNYYKVYNELNDYYNIIMGLH